MGLPINGPMELMCCHTLCSWLLRKGPVVLPSTNQQSNIALANMKHTCMYVYTLPFMKSYLCISPCYILSFPTICVYFPLFSLIICWLISSCCWLVSHQPTVCWGALSSGPAPVVDRVALGAPARAGAHHAGGSHLSGAKWFLGLANDKMG